MKDYPVTDRSYLFSRLKLYGIVAGLLMLYAVGLPKLMLFLGLARRIPILPTWDVWGTYAFLGLLPLFGWQVHRVIQSVGQRATQEAAIRVQEGYTYLILPPLHPKSALETRFREKGDMWAQIARLLPEGESLIVELVRTPHRLCYLVTGMRNTLEMGIIPQLLATLPDTQVRYVPVAEDPLVSLFLDGTTPICQTLRPQKGKLQIRPATSDPFLALVGALAQLPPDIQGGLRLYVRSDVDSSTDFQINAEMQSVPLLNQRNPAYTSNTVTWPWERRIVSQKDQDSQRDLQARAGRHLLDVCVQVWAHAPETSRAALYAEMLAQTLQSQYTPTNPLMVHPYVGDFLDRTYPVYAGRHWTDQELGTLWHFVGKEGYEIAPMLELSRTRPLPPDPVHFYHADMHLLAVDPQDVLPV